ncbi:circularly permuted type 2 ATP-grasp protein [Nakamurella flavida]|uniref:Circularly permuted type 2 ATP-grasp protein n=1 Tax=Nakamurella flavida TaxID=363630 RepID=A0A938YQU5_9ACTN|nr:circularly permuted type 2 ATP-grasp protein [Nakamurella flavida]MBM9477265.1 circularly permuted type 2 ATP-grasp protein [Nakamurella flavida]MDP9779721.1 putative circularly permuted ATP-grasp superfamily protein [Nakamurella flavida]
MADLFQDYPAGAAWDEMFSGPGEVRPAYEQVHAVLRTINGADLSARAEIMGRAFLDQGVTFALGGVERPFPLDLVPRVVTAQEWVTVERGVPQRVRALEAFLADAYGQGRIFADGVIPRRLVTTSPHFHRQVAGMGHQDGARIVISGVDLIRDEHGTFRVLEDNVRVPSGVSYVLENRQAVTQVLTEAGGDQVVRPVSEYPGRLLAALRAVAPWNVTDPTVVVLTPGVYNSAYFEHTLLAREMGVELVEGRDLICRNNRVYLRTTASEMPVHVIYRRVDDEFLDPVQFRMDSLLGSPGLVNAARAGNLTIANAVGNGIADDKLIYTYVPDIIRYYLGEDPILPNVDTYRMEEPEHREYALEHLHQLVLKPVDGSGGKGIVIGSRADRATLSKARATILDNPRGWIAQNEIQLSTVPTLIGDRLRPRHVDLRPFAVNDGNAVWVLPGGLTRVALPEGELIVNSSQGGGSKDTWVLAGPVPEPEPVRPAPADATVMMPAITADMFDPPVTPDDDGHAMRTQQGQQQQQQPAGPAGGTDAC